MNETSYTKTLEYILHILKHVKNTHVIDDGYVSLPSILDFFSYNNSFIEATEMADYLEAKGWVNSLKSIGEILIQITPSGLIHLENLGEQANSDFEKMISKLSKKKTKSINIKDIKNEKDPKKKVINLTDEIKNDISKIEGSKSDLVKDVEILKMEISKNNPDLNIIELKLMKFENMGSLKKEITRLRNFIVHE